MDEFLFLCRAFGQLEDLSQAGGGNISVKISDTTSIIKSSGVSLSEVTATYGYTILNHKQVFESLGSTVEPSLESFVQPGSMKPSLESYFHCFLKKYVVHIHPTLLLPHLCSGAPCCISYESPGFELSKTVYAHYTNQTCIHLANHGVIFTADTIPELLECAHQEYERFRNGRSISLRTFWDIQKEHPNMYIYKLSHAETCAYLPILTQFGLRPITPDFVVFLYDSLIIRDNQLFIKAPSKLKCLSILEVLRSYCDCVASCDRILTDEQVTTILHMPAEHYRKSLP